MIAPQVWVAGRYINGCCLSGLVFDPISCAGTAVQEAIKQLVAMLQHSVNPDQSWNVHVGLNGVGLILPCPVHSSDDLCLTYHQ